MGKEWRTPTLWNLLLSPRIAGLRERQGRAIGKAVWPSIIPTEPGYAGHLPRACRSLQTTSGADHASGADL